MIDFLPRSTFPFQERLHDFSVLVGSGHRGVLSVDFRGRPTLDAAVGDHHREGLDHVHVNQAKVPDTKRKVTNGFTFFERTKDTFDVDCFGAMAGNK